MADWDSRQYLMFERERTQPAIDLADSLFRRPVASVGAGELLPLTRAGVVKLLDAGCGPGNSTAVLAEAFPGADILGVDSSPAMIHSAQAAYPALRFAPCDLSGDLAALGGGYDIVFSNACLQWVPDHPRLLPRLMDLLRPGGRLAVQLPVNQREPIHIILAELAASPRWQGYFPEMRSFHTLAAGQYYEILRGCATGFVMWQTTYCHVLDGHQAILEWYRGTGMRPYLAVLPEAERPAFEDDVRFAVRNAYPAQGDGRVIFPFPRFFFIAAR